jgi:hypothetical protein
MPETARLQLLVHALGLEPLLREPELPPRPPPPPPPPPVLLPLPVSGPERVPEPGPP